MKRRVGGIGKPKPAQRDAYPSVDPFTQRGGHRSTIRPFHRALQYSQFEGFKRAVLSSLLSMRRTSA